MGEHDRLFKRAFRIPAHAAGELLAVLPRDLSEVVDLSTLALAETNLVGRKLGERFSDALFHATFGGKVQGYIWFLFAHQSEPDDRMPLRLLEELVHGWVELARSGRPGSKLPPVVAVVVHHGERGWTAPTRLHEMIEGLDELPVLRKYVPDFEIIVDDLVQKADEELKQRPLPLFPKVVLWLLRDSRNIERLMGHIRQWAEELTKLTREAPDDMVTVLRYLMEVVGDESFDTVKRQIIEVAPDTEVTMGTAAQAFRAEGEARGRAEGEARGRAEGEARGRAEGKASALIAILEARGIRISTDERTRIAECRDMAELDRWLHRAVTVASVRELFSQ